MNQQKRVCFSQEFALKFSNLFMDEERCFFCILIQKYHTPLGFEYPVSVFGNTNARYLLICSRHQWEGVICQTGATEPNSTLL